MIDSHQITIDVSDVIIVSFHSLRERGQCPWLNNQVLHVFKSLAAHWLKFTALEASSSANCEDRHEAQNLKEDRR